MEDKDIIPTIAANKSDLYQEKQVANETEEKFANQIGAILLQLRPKMTVGFKPCLITSVKKYLITISTSLLLKRKRKTNIKRKNNKKIIKKKTRLIKELK